MALTPRRGGIGQNVGVVLHQADSDWARDKLAAIFGESGQTKLTRFLILAGDHRPYDTIIRTINNAATGAVRRLSGELRVVLSLLADQDKIPSLLGRARGQKATPEFRLLDPPKVSAAPPKRRS